MRKKVQIEIDNREVRKILSDTVKLQKTIGFEMMKKLKLRIEQIRAASNFKEFLDIGLGDPHPLVGNLDAAFDSRSPKSLLKLTKIID